jgi:hypothetical protein
MVNDTQSPDRPADTDELTRRLDIYERFDKVIHEQVERANDLLREAADLRAELAAQTETHQHTTVAELTKERERYRSLFAAMLDDVTELQGQAERLARRLSDALDEIEELLPAPGEQSSPITAERPSPEPELPEPPEDETPKRPAPPADDSVLIEPKSPSSPPEPKTDFLEEDEPAPVVDDTLLDVGGRKPASAQQSERCTLLIHGLNGTISARTLKRHLEHLPNTSLVEPHEFSSGIARFTVTAVPPFDFDDLSGWSAPGSFELLNQRSGLVEIRVGNQ